MSKRRDLDRRTHALTEITGILSAMKTLALLETQRLARHVAAQHRAVRSIEAAAADFFAHFPHAAVPTAPGPPLLLLIGSERGFCGDYNEALVASALRAARDQPGGEPRLLTVGRKLSRAVGTDARLVAALPGPNVSEEIQPILIRLMEMLRSLQAEGAADGLLPLHVWHHRPSDGGAEITSSRPLFPENRAGKGFADPPVLYLDPVRFAAGLFDEYLLAVLQETLYDALMAENLRRFQQMEQAVHRLEKDLAALRTQRNRLRQEEITEEIELIMLSAEALGQPRKPR